MIRCRPAPSVSVAVPDPVALREEAAVYWTSTRTGEGEGFESASSVVKRWPPGPATSRTIGASRVAVSPLTRTSRCPAGESQPFAFFSTTSRTTTPGSPVLKVIRDVPAPDVIVPFVIVQVQPGPTPPTTSATMPEAPLSTLAGAEMTGSAGRAFTGMRAEPETSQPAATRIVTARTAVPACPAVHETDRFPRPESIVPFVIDHV